MFAGAKMLVAPEAGSLIVTALEKMVSGQEIAPRVEGRIVIER